MVVSNYTSLTPPYLPLKMDKNCESSVLSISATDLMIGPEGASSLFQPCETGGNLPPLLHCQSSYFYIDFQPLTYIKKLCF